MGSPRGRGVLNSSVMYSVLELASGGELLQYLIHGGRFEEAIARFYFKQLIAGLEYLHQSGYVHRNIRPEHLLLDDHFNLLLSNFSSSIELSGRDGTGVLRTINSTTGYSAPEIHSKVSYSGVAVDLFAAGVVLFILFSGTPPFGIANSSDNYYRLLAAKEYDKFWTFHNKQKKQTDFYPAEFKSLVNALLELDPQERPTIDEVKAHPWYAMEAAGAGCVLNEMRRRKLHVEESIQLRRDAMAQNKLNMMNKPMGIGFRGICPSFRGAVLEVAPQEEDMNTMDGTLQEMFANCKVEGGQPNEFNPNQQLKFSTVVSEFTPIDLLKCTACLCNLLYKNVEVDKEEWTVRCNIPGRSVMMKLKLQVLSFDGLSALEFVKEEGDIFEFAAVVRKLTTQLDVEEEPRL